ncbi:MAG: IPT/TIG domain-containing protein, partial [Solirubrobacterales bacterium]|nr:IPT/TIG domain-containing protein [Solirubrobacterales bacterium]
ARAQVSATVGAAEPAYAFRGARGALTAANPAQNFTLTAARSGVLLAGKQLRVGIALRALGYGNSISALPSASPRAHGNRVSYLRSGVSEWYANGPLGVEQGFTLARAPAHRSKAPLTLALALSGAKPAGLSADGQSVKLIAARGGTLRYGGLVALDATGRALHSWIAVAQSELLLRVDTRGARFPLRIDPIIEDEPEAKLTGAPEAAAGDKFGLSVALSADGATALVGAPRASGLAGAAWVFTRSTTGWTQPGVKLSGPAGADVKKCVAPGDNGEGEDPMEQPGECRFGRSVALSSDGATALVGAPLSEGHMGTAWVFTRTGASWGLQQVLGDPDPALKSHFGAGVAIAADGHTAIVGAPADHFYRGSAWAFTRSGTKWTQSGAALSPADEEGQGRFGQNVAISANGEAALVGAPSDGGGQGAAWVFGSTGSGWSVQSGKLSAGSGGNFGSSVALAGDGQSALIGARENDEQRGAAYAFAHKGTAWSAQGQPLTGTGEAGEEFGYSVALSTSGARALVGASGHESEAGAAWLFAFSGGAWTAQEQLEAGAQGSASARFGSSVALASGAETFLVGGRRDTQIGAAWVFGSGPSLTAVTPNRGPLSGGTAVTITGNNLAGATAVHFGAAAAVSFTVTSKHSITAVTPAGEGVVTVSVTTPYGTSSIGPEFTYVRSKGSQETPPVGATVPGALGTTGSTVTTPSGGVLGFSSGGGCSVSLLSKSLAVQKRGRAVVRLRVSGTGRCAGKLRLRVTRRLSKRSARLKTIGTAVFSIPAGATVTIRVKLNAAGRGLLSAHRGRLSASLLLVRQSPAPALAQSAKVRLARAKKHSSAHA